MIFSVIIVYVYCWIAFELKDKIQWKCCQIPRLKHCLRPSQESPTISTGPPWVGVGRANIIVYFVVLVHVKPITPKKQLSNVQPTSILWSPVTYSNPLIDIGPIDRCLMPITTPKSMSFSLSTLIFFVFGKWNLNICFLMNFEDLLMSWSNFLTWYLPIIISHIYH